MDTLATVTSLIATAVSAGLFGAVVKAYATKRTYDSRDHALEIKQEGDRDATLTRILERRDEDCRRLGERYDLARTENELRASQVGDLAARVELMEKTLETLTRENTSLREENKRLVSRVSKLERERGTAITPSHDTPAVGVRKQPLMSESVGGYRHGGER